MPGAPRPDIAAQLQQAADRRQDGSVTTEPAAGAADAETRRAWKQKGYGQWAREGKLKASDMVFQGVPTGHSTPSIKELDGARAGVSRPASPERAPARAPSPPSRERPAAESKTDATRPPSPQPQPQPQPVQFELQPEPNLPQEERAELQHVGAQAASRPASPETPSELSGRVSSSRKVTFVSQEPDLQTVLLAPKAQSDDPAPEPPPTSSHRCARMLYAVGLVVLLLCALGFYVVQAEKPGPEHTHGTVPSSFDSSRLLTLEWGETLNDWAGGRQPNGTDQRWELCCSTFLGCDDASAFHDACDAHSFTLTVARNAGDNRSNPGNFTFGGFVRATFRLSGSRH